MRAAVFSDVEGTLVNVHIPALFLKIGREMGLFSPWQRIQLGPLMLGERLLPGKLGRRVQLLAMLRAMAGLPEQTVEPVIAAMVPALSAHIKPGMLRRIQAHQAAGLPLVLVSGGLHEVIARFGAALGGHGEGTKLLHSDGRYRARLDGEVCQGMGKANRARAILARMGYDPAACYAYGDTASDIPFLALFGHPHAVDPDPVLAAEARRRGWPILDGAATDL